MVHQASPAAGDDPVVLRPGAGVAWLWVVLAAFFGFALVRGYLGAATIAGRVGVVIFMGTCIALFLWAALYMITHRAVLSISVSTITWTLPARARAAGPRKILVLESSRGRDLRFLTVRRGKRTYVNGLTIPNTGTILRIRTFDPNQVRQACLAKGWRFPT